MMKFIKKFISWLKKRKMKKRLQEQNEYYNKFMNAVYKTYLENADKVDIDKAVIFVDGKRIK